MNIVMRQFEWDEVKNAKNIKNHGIDFITASRVFKDPSRLEIYDSNHSIDEDRYNVIGLVDDILFVVYTQRVNRIRIISARRANRWEQEVYWNGNDNY